jgi:hypothetical protein
MLCADCENNLNECPTNDCTYLGNLPHFLQREMLVRPEGVAVLYDPASFEIHTLASLNDTWTYDTATGEQATVTSASLGEVLGEPDSLKFISLANGGSIVLSKAHGIVSYPSGNGDANYELIGIGGADIGTRVPSLNEVFNFQPNDEFIYENHLLDLGGDCYDSVFKIKINSRTDYLDSIVYNTTQLHRYHSYSCSNPQLGSQIGSYMLQQDVAFRKSDLQHLEMAAPGALAAEAPIYPLYSEILDNTYVRCKVYTYSGRQAVTFGQDHYLDYAQTELPTCPTFIPAVGQSIDTVHMVYGGLCVQAYSSFVEGLGRTFDYKNNGFESEYTEWLTGALVQGVEIGDYREDAYFITAVNELDGATISLYPNPAEDEVMLTLSDIYRTVSVTDMNGVLVMRVALSGLQNTIAIDDLDSGTYCVSGTNDHGTFTRKIVVVH